LPDVFPQRVVVADDALGRPNPLAERRRKRLLLADLDRSLQAKQHRLATGGTVI
jgi:hypothetical protein